MKPNSNGKFTSMKEPTRSLTVMGLDLSLSNTGLVVWSDQKVKAHCLKKTTTKLTTEERIEAITKSIMLCVRKHKPDLVVIENHAFNSHGGSSNALHELHGVVKNRLWKSESPFVVLPPTSLKKEATGSGKASKEEMIATAEKLWPKLRNISGKKDDLADALHLARYGAINYYFLVEEEI